jgi:hypothetical protein
MPAVGDPRVTTEIPPAGAGPFRVTVAVQVFPPVTEVGESVSPETTGLLTVKVAVTETESRVAVRVTEVFAVTATVETLNVVDVAPAGTVTVAGSLA